MNKNIQTHILLLVFISFSLAEVAPTGKQAVARVEQAAPAHDQDQDETLWEKIKRYKWWIASAGAALGISAAAYKFWPQNKNRARTPVPPVQAHGTHARTEDNNVQLIDHTPAKESTSLPSSSFDSHGFPIPEKIPLWDPIFTIDAQSKKPLIAIQKFLNDKPQSALIAMPLAREVADYAYARPHPTENIAHWFARAIPDGFENDFFYYQHEPLPLFTKTQSEHAYLKKFRYNHRILSEKKLLEFYRQEVTKGSGIWRRGNGGRFTAMRARFAVRNPQCKTVRNPQCKNEMIDNRTQANEKIYPAFSNTIEHVITHLKKMNPLYHDWLEKERVDQKRFLSLIKPYEAKLEASGGFTMEQYSKEFSPELKKLAPRYLKQAYLKKRGG